MYKYHYNFEKFLNYYCLTSIKKLQKRSNDVFYHNKLNCPTFIAFDKNDGIMSCCFRIYNKLHRTDGPAVLFFYHNKIKKEYWLANTVYDKVSYYMELISFI